jgi:hypothetical protein
MKLTTNTNLNGMNAKRTSLNALTKHIQNFNGAHNLSRILKLFLLHLFLKIFECKIILFYFRIANKLDVNIKFFNFFQVLIGCRSWGYALL